MKESLTLHLSESDIRVAIVKFLHDRDYRITGEISFRIEERGGDPLDRFPGTPTVVGADVAVERER